jgi:hypothetical protein
MESNKYPRAKAESFVAAKHDWIIKTNLEDGKPR